MKLTSLMLLSLVSSALLFAGGIEEERVEGMVADEAYNRMLLRLLDGRAELIGVEEALGLQRSGEVNFLDARTEEEFEISRIPGAVHIGFEEPDFSILEGVDENRLLILYCSVGYRSERMAAQLAELGYPRVVNLYGGIFEWHNRGYSLQDEQGETRRIHGYKPLWGRWIDAQDMVVY